MPLCPPKVRRFLRFATVLLLSAPSLIAATFQGVVRDRQTSTPLAGMVVAAYTAAGFLQATGTTDPAGRYVLTVPAGGYRVLAYDNNGTYATTFGNDAESFETSPVVTVGASDTRTIDFTLTRGGTVVGQVSANGVLVANAVVEAYNLSGTRRGFTRTNGAGMFSLVLPPGEYKLAAFEESGTFAAEFFRDRATFAEADRVAVNAGQTSVVQFTLPRTSRLNGLVTDTSGRGLGGIEVRAYNSGGALVARTTTNATGAFTLTVPAGGYRFVALDPALAYASEFLGHTDSFERSQLVSVQEGDERNDLRFTLTRGGRFSGRVLDAQSGAALADVSVAAYNLDGTLRATTRTASDGTYTLVVPPGEYKLAAFDESLRFATEFYGGTRTFRGAGALPAVQEITAASLDFRLDAGLRVSGTVREGTMPVAGITVAAFDPSGEFIASGTTNAAGQYALVVAPGEYRLVAFDPELRYAVAFESGTSFDAAPPRTVGAAVTVDFAVARGIRIGGTVVDPRGRPLDGLEITALDANGNRVASATSREGAFELVLLPGTYRFRYGGHETASLVTITNESRPTLSFVVSPAVRRRPAGR